MLLLEFWVSYWKGWADIALRQRHSAQQVAEGEHLARHEKSAYLTPCPSQPKNGAPLSEVLAHMNHDLRTPLNAVIGFAQIIESEMHGQLSPQYLEYARHIQESGFDLLAKIEELVTLAETNSNEAPKKPVAARPKLIRHEEELALAE